MEDTLLKSKAQNALPFGFLFEEPAPSESDVIKPTYDPEAKLSYVQLESGEYRPLVEVTPEELCTPDSSKILMATSTVTETKREVTDSDPERKARTVGFQRLLTDTQTVTLNSRETTDSDPSPHIVESRASDLKKVWQVLLEATGTETKRPRETTDRD